MRVKHAVDEMDSLQGVSSKRFNSAMSAFIRAAMGDGDVSVAREHLRNVIARTMILSDILGRRRMLLEVDSKHRVKLSATPEQSIVQIDSQVVFEDAVQDILRREPRLASNAEEVQKVYGAGHSFALARSTELKLTQRIQTAIANLIEQGKSADDASLVIAEMGDFTRAYADTVFRTNLNTAYSAGRFRQAFDPDIAEIVGAFEYNAVGDIDTRDNHDAADGLIAGTTDPIWDIFAPPLGYLCRCSLRTVDRFELDDLKLLGPNGTIIRKTPAGFSSARPDVGFGRGRPDRRIYQS